MLIVSGLEYPADNRIVTKKENETNKIEKRGQALRPSRALESCQDLRGPLDFHGRY